MNFVCHTSITLPNWIHRTLWCGNIMMKNLVWRWSRREHDLIKTSKVIGWKESGRKPLHLNQWMMTEWMYAVLHSFIHVCTLTAVLWSVQQVWANKKQTGDACSKVYVLICRSAKGRRVKCRNWRVTAEQKGAWFSSPLHRSMLELLQHFMFYEVIL